MLFNIANDARVAGQSLWYHKPRCKRLESNVKAEAKGDVLISSLISPHYICSCVSLCEKLVSGEWLILCVPQNWCSDVEAFKDSKQTCLKFF